VLFVVVAKVGRGGSNAGVVWRGEQLKSPIEELIYCYRSALHDDALGAFSESVEWGLATKGLRLYFVFMFYSKKMLRGMFNVLPSSLPPDSWSTRAAGMCCDNLK
jgi:hypothetical protein